MGGSEHQFLLRQFENLSQKLDKQTEELTKIKIELANIKYARKLAGSITSGIISIVIGLIFKFFDKG